jgi:uncharacterized protein YcfJ
MIQAVYTTLILSQRRKDKMVQNQCLHCHGRKIEIILTTFKNGYSGVEVQKEKSGVNVLK